MVSSPFLSRPLRIAFIVATFLSLVWLPWALTLFLAFLSGLIFPPLALLVGVVADALYYPGLGYLSASILGAFLMALAYLVRYFVKTRIM